MVLFRCFSTWLMKSVNVLHILPTKPGQVDSREAISYVGNFIRAQTLNLSASLLIFLSQLHLIFHIIVLLLLVVFMDAGINWNVKGDQHYVFFLLYHLQTKQVNPCSGKHRECLTYSSKQHQPYMHTAKMPFKGDNNRINRFIITEPAGTLDLLQQGDNHRACWNSRSLQQGDNHTVSWNSWTPPTGW